VYWEEVLFIETPILIFLFSCIASLGYSWFGIAYALTLIVFLGMLDLDINYLITGVLFSQLSTALFSSFLKKKMRFLGKKDFKSIIILTVSSLIAFLSAYFVGINISSSLRLLLSVYFLFFSGGVLLITVISTGSNEKKTNDEIVSLIAGFSGGIVKGIVGAGITPIMVGIQSVLGLKFDVIVSRTILSEVGIILATIIPYILKFGVELKITLILIIGGLVGVSIGGYLSQKIHSKKKAFVSSIGMILLALISLFYN